MINDMAKVDRPDVTYGAFESEDEFLQWVKTNHGTDVSAICKARLNEALGTGHPVNAIAILDSIVRSTRKVDLAKNNFRARFVW
jgi:hypothetical protein